MKLCMLSLDTAHSTNGLSAVEVAGDIVDLGNGMYRGTYTARVSGTYELYVTTGVCFMAVFVNLSLVPKMFFID